MHVFTNDDEITEENRPKYGDTNFEAACFHIQAATSLSEAVNYIFNEVSFNIITRLASTVGLRAYTVKRDLRWCELLAAEIRYNLDEIAPEPKVSIFDGTIDPE